MKILIDNGHGVNTPGKCSPDGVFREYKYTREIAAAVVKHQVFTRSVRARSETSYSSGVTRAASKPR